MLNLKIIRRLWIIERWDGFGRYFVPLLDCSFATKKEAVSEAKRMLKKELFGSYRISLYEPSGNVIDAEIHKANPSCPFVESRN